MSVPFQIGDKVECIDNSDFARDKLTIGKTYTIIEYEEDDGDAYVTIMSDQDRELDFCAKRFTREITHDHRAPISNRG